MGQVRLSVVIESQKPAVAPASGEVVLREWDSRDKFKRAVRALGMSWGLALLAVLIPILHFVLVPLLFLAGPVAAYLVYHQQNVILGGDGVCPECRKPLRIVRSPVSWPLRELCESCQAELRISSVS